MKTYISLIFFLITLFSSASALYYYHIEDEALKRVAHDKEILKAQVLRVAKESVTNLTLFESSIKTLQQTNPLSEVKLQLKKLSFSEDILLKKVFLNSTGWFVSDVTVDNTDGEISVDDSGIYTLQLSKDKQEAVEIKFQAIKDSIIKDFLIPFATNRVVLSTNETNSTATFEEIQEDDFSLFIKDNFIVDRELLRDKFYTFIIALSIFMSMMALSGYLFYRFVIIKNFSHSIKGLNNYVENIIKGKMLKESALESNSKELKNLYANTIELSKKFINVSNELTVSKDIIYQKERSDELTGLPNKKSFENDLKYMFISNKDGYIIYLKIDKIGLFTKNHGPEIVDSLIEDFAQLINNFINKERNRNGAIYRFFGGEFSIILYENSIEKVEKFLLDILELTDTLRDKYYFFDRAIYYGASPFDHYGTIESIMQSAQEAYEVALKEKTKSYFIVDLMQQAEFNKKLEGSVKDIIKRNDFVLQYLHDTLTFGENPKLLMQEVSPLIIDSFTYENIPTGKFISVAEKIGVVADFDKALILKVLEQIEFGGLEHKICVVLSIPSIANKLFISWLETMAIENPLIKNIIFTSACYSVASNFEDFKHFNSILKAHNLENMIKKYDPTDLSLESLIELKPSYLKLDRNFCQDFKKDSTKQHVVKQILLFSDTHDIKVIGDSLKSEQDYLAFEMLGVYGNCH
ncbi:diguanylate cyclase/phosphodiesterase [Sulfurimonas denitrificans DSM 1251]|uniref:Diguanylate cyclase/phosphodiesterase n=1 Tax=Sulfurimonas denitrificans (strain ATCC 33889 / DSM 1251) TaxID=326298 RepID=Q30RA7_SULDN|nr:EAL domain-containing protein [Sulfurimonas denitrificans]ABB44474.1 diguanylate cyclase/phosphodiesterase [Sulfurimonas denitrificans DSM 1251]MDD3441656.1 EAL domain-containing protein [Sulfurimonas denitrificans]